METNSTQDGNPQVLIVDDNLVNQKLSAKFLQKLGCEVSIVDNGKKAVEEVKGKTFDIVFMDCQMPIMDGYARPPVPFVLLRTEAALTFQLLQ